MVIGIFSDVHDQLEHLERMAAEFTRRGIERTIFCGDFCSGIPAAAMGGYPFAIDSVFGNGDGDRFTMTKIVAARSPNLTLHGEYAELSVAGRKIGVTHYPFYARAMGLTGEYDAVFSGHTHERHEERLGDCLWVNPGEILGWKGAPSCAIYDAVRNEIEFVSLT